MSFATRSTIAALAGAVAVAAHGHVNSIIVNGVEYAGYDVTKLPYMADPPVVVGWANTATDNGFVAPDAYGSPDIICHRDGENAGGHAAVAAGDNIFLQWDTWPDSHKGPIIDYLASCGSAGCESVDKTALEFFKISEAGLKDGSASPGTYADTDLLANGNGWMVKIPENIKPGSYVLRHEIIALHSGGQENGAQNYPQCFNLEITGSGTEQPAGTLGTELYKSTDEGILFNIYTPLDSYPIPGPELIAGASAISPQTKSVAESTGTPTVGSGSGGDSPAEPTEAPASSSAAAEPTTPAPTSAPAEEPSAPASTEAPAPTPVAPATTSAAAPQPTSEPEEPVQPCTKKAKRSKKVRRHVRDVKARNVAPMKRVAPVKN